MIHVGNGLYRGPRPKSWADLKAAGITIAYKFQSGAHEEFYDDLLEKEDAADFGIRLVNIPCSDIFPPKEWQIRKFVTHANRETSYGQKCYAFCRHGKDRTGVMCMAFEVIVLKKKLKDAKENMFKLGFHKIPYLLWLPFAERTIKKIAGI